MRLQKVRVCISHKSTIRFIDPFAKDFDIPVKMWCKEISDMIWKVYMHALYATLILIIIYWVI